MESLLAPPLNIQLLHASPAESHSQVHKVLSTCIDNHELLPYVIGGNTFAIKNHLYKIRDEVKFLSKKRKDLNGFEPVTSQVGSNNNNNKTKKKSKNHHRQSSQIP